jgi:RNA polymerase sigma-70 factor, ECF subfamily
MPTNAEMHNENPRSALLARTGPAFAAEFAEPRTILDRHLPAILPRLKRYARRLTHDEADGDDLVQDCVTRALANLRLWKPGTDLRAWLFTVMHNRYIDEVSRATRRGRNVVWQESSRISICLPNQIEYLECLDLERAVMSLSDEQRSILLLVGLSAWNYDQIASACNLPVATVRSRLSRGRAALRKLAEIAAELRPPKRTTRHGSLSAKAALAHPMRGPPASTRFEQ